MPLLPEPILHAQPVCWVFQSFFSRTRRELTSYLYFCSRTLLPFFFVTLAHFRLFGSAAMWARKENAKEKRREKKMEGSLLARLQRERERGLLLTWSGRGGIQSLVRSEWAQMQTKKREKKEKEGRKKGCLYIFSDVFANQSLITQQDYLLTVWTFGS